MTVAVSNQITDGYLTIESLHHHAYGEGFSSLQDLVINRAENKLDSSQFTELKALLANDNAITTVNEVIAALKTTATFDLLKDFNNDRLNEFTKDLQVKKWLVLSVVIGNLESNRVYASFGYTMKDTRFSPTDKLTGDESIDLNAGNNSIAKTLWNNLFGDE